MYKQQLLTGIKRNLETFFENVNINNKDEYTLQIVFNPQTININIAEGNSLNKILDLEKQVKSLRIQIPKPQSALLEKNKESKQHFEVTKHNYANKNSDINDDWIVIQRRLNGKLDFITERYLYSRGFSDPGGEHWIGCEELHRLTAHQPHELYVELVDTNDKKSFAHYDNFSIGSSEEGYRLKSLGMYDGNAGDELRSHENHEFEFYDNWRGVYKSFCWWKAPMYKCNLNGTYGKSNSDSYPNGIWWGGITSIKSCKMSIRPK